MSDKEINKTNLNEFQSEENFLEANEEGNLEFDGSDTVDLAEKYGTPLYVVSENRIRENYRKIYDSFNDQYTNTEISYACKANPNINVLRTLKSEGCMAEVISTGELFLVRTAGFEGKKIVFNGCNKNKKGIRLAIKMGVLINVDSFHELKVVHEEAEKLDQEARIGFRVNPTVQAGTLDVWETAMEESKFGISMDNALEAYRKAKSMDHIDICGIHTHIGSHVEDEEPYASATERVMDFVHKLKKEDIELEVVDMGGGFPIPFHHEETTPIEKYARAIGETFKTKIEEHDLNTPRLLLEPGGSIVGDAALLLLEVGTVKRRESSKKWACVDGGANINLRATQGWYTYQTVCCNKMDEPKEEIFDIGGPLCYSGDVLGKDRKMPRLEEGDIIGMLDCGGYTMAIRNRYNSHPYPAVILLTDKGSKVIRRRENYTDLLEDEKLLF